VILSQPPTGSMIASVHPSGEPASSLRARFCSAPRPPFRGLTAATARANYLILNYDPLRRSDSVVLAPAGQRYFAVLPHGFRGFGLQDRIGVIAD
jgi:hypothetical protein